MNGRLRINRFQFATTEEPSASLVTIGLCMRSQTIYMVIADILAVCVSLLLYSYVAGRLSPFAPDDSYISARYAANLAQGHGITFNVEQMPVEGYSNFLWVLLLAAGALLGQEITIWSANLGLALGGLTIFLVWWILRRRGLSGLRLVLPVGLLSLSGPLVLYAVSGMETALYTCLLVAAVLLTDYLLERRSWPFALLLGLIGFLLALSRPEGLLALPVLLACMLYFGRHRLAGDEQRPLPRYLLASALLFLALLAIYHIWRINYFDALLPTPFLSKGGGGSSFINAWFTNARFFFERQTHYFAPMAYYYGAFALLALIAAAVSFKKRFERRIELTALVLALVYMAVYVNFIDWMPGMRYYAPLTALLLIPVTILARELAVPQLQGERWRTQLRVELPFVLLCLMLAGLSLFSTAVLRLDSQRLQANTATSSANLGRWLHETMAADTILAISDVGATPYYSQLPTVDINPESLTDRHIAEHGWSSDYFFSVDPDVVVLTAFSLTQPDFYPQHEALYAAPRFQATYQLIGITRNDWYLDRSYWVFVRQGTALSEAQLASFPQGISKQ